MSKALDRALQAFSRSLDREDEIFLERWRAYVAKHREFLRKATLPNDATSAILTNDNPDAEAEMGGRGSGNYGHAGRPGKVGGSGKGGPSWGSVDPAQEPWKLTDEQWEDYVKSRSGYPGLPEHIPDWHETEGLLPGRLDMHFTPTGRTADYASDIWESTIGSPRTPTVHDETIDLTSPAYPDWKKLETYAVDESVGRLKPVIDTQGWSHVDIDITDGRYSARSPFDDEPFNVDKEGIYRGMCGEEMWDITKRGYIQSSGSLNLSGQEGLTYFSDEPDMARSYAAGFAPWTHKPTFEAPAYVVRIGNPPKTQISINENTPNEIGVRGRVPKSDITDIWEIRLASQSPASMEIWYNRYDKTIAQGSGGGGHGEFYVYRKVPREEWQNLIPYHERMRKEHS